MTTDLETLLQRYYEAHPEEVERVLQAKLDEMVDSVIKPLRARMDLLQGQLIYIHARIDKLHNIQPKKTKGVEV